MTKEDKIAVVKASLAYGYGCFIRTRYNNEKVVHHCENKVEYLVYWEDEDPFHGASLYCGHHKETHCTGWGSIVKVVKIDAD
jgi:hypothetical protein